MHICISAVEIGLRGRLAIFVIYENEYVDVSAKCADMC